MTVDPYQILSLAGAALILVAYAAAQMGKMPTGGVPYQLLNLLGGAALCTTAVHTLQYGFIVLEGAWTVLSAGGLVKVLRTERSGPR